ncbi:hypothetical protein HanHA300_Chr17g0649981 [Helianthus annuus]|nr:hypothetical protein HanHA300_Chr17g0649981 [Helianthus annuus]KAJ0447114.1 hypothetical protein HanHA89_Chr17g0701721 [Helianthus annuus]KAJ0632019.1 hypothetical protein HanLR1_Chr17g0660391 [Helianthus annuus]
MRVIVVSGIRDVFKEALEKFVTQNIGLETNQNNRNWNRGMRMRNRNGWRNILLFQVPTVSSMDCFGNLLAHRVIIKSPLSIYVVEGIRGTNQTFDEEFVNHFAGSLFVFVHLLNK